MDVIRSDILNSIGALVTGLDIPIPPMRQGKAKILRSSLSSCLPISAGMNDCLWHPPEVAKDLQCWGLRAIGSSTCYIHKPLVRAV